MNAKRKFTVEPKETPKQQFLNQFADALIKRMEEIKANGSQWKKGWISVEMGSATSVGGYCYTGSNAWYLDFVAGMCYSVNVWGTFNAITSLKGENGEKVLINKGTHAHIILKPYEVYFMKREDREQHPDMKPRITPEQFAKLTEEDKALYNKGVDFQNIKVFNLDQTNLKEVNPSLYEKYAPAKVENDLTNAFKFRPLDELIENQSWVCPIRTKLQDRAFFSPLNEIIVVPAKEQFNSQQEFYFTLLHEMAHSTSIETGRKLEVYAKEELIAELSAAFSGSKMGITTIIEQDNSAHYLASWLDTLKKNPEYMREILEDVEKATKVIEEKVSVYMENN